jgi:ABC-type bacteriocin/lantibiotic exporter with double-glycine peptidase domain
VVAHRSALIERASRVVNVADGRVIQNISSLDHRLAL